MSNINALLILCGRIVFAFAFMFVVLLVKGRFQMFIETLKNRDTMRYLVPAALLISFNWGLYIWAVNSGRILDASLGYYINPLIVFLLGVLLFREKFTKLQLIAVALAFAGVLLALVAFGSFPIVSLSLALTFSVYGVLKKKARCDQIISIAVESLILTPFALAFSFVFMSDHVASVSALNFILLVGGGALTALPLIMYARAVNNITFLIVGFFQYISPSLSLIYGLISGETPSASQLVSFAFIGLGLFLFSIAVLRVSKKTRTLPDVR